MKNRIRSRQFAAACTIVALATVVAGCGSSSPADELTKVSMQTSWTPSIGFGPEYLAADRGYYADEGLDVEILPGGPEADVPSLIDSGAVTIGAVGADNIALANANGADLVIVAAGYQASPLGLISLADDPISAPEEMYGKTIGVPTGDNAAHEIFLEVNDLDESQINVVPVGYDMTPLLNGEVDAIYGYVTSAVPVIEAAGEEPSTFLLSDYGLSFFADAFAVKRSTLEDDRDLVLSFLRAELRGFEDFVDDPEPAVDLLVSTYGADTGADAETAHATATLIRDLIVTDETEQNGLLTMSDDAIAANVTSLTDLGIEGVDASLFDPSLMAEIQAGDQ